MNIYFPLFQREVDGVPPPMQLTDLQRSFEYYTQQHITGVSLSWPGVPLYELGNCWIEPRIMVTDREFFASGTTNYFLTSCSMDFSIMVEKSGATISDRTRVLRDIVTEHFRTGQDIPIRNFTAGGGTTLAMLRIRELTEDSELKRLPALLYGYLVSFDGDFVEEESRP